MTILTFIISADYLLMSLINFIRFREILPTLSDNILTVFNVM